jgi:hypothetical protein
VHSLQVVSEVYSLQQVKVEPHVVLSLVLYKMVDANSEVREDAMHMLQVLSMREWHTSATDLASAAAGAAGQSEAAGQNSAGQRVDQDVEGESGSVLVLGALQDSYQQFQYELAVSLARCAGACGVLQHGIRGSAVRQASYWQNCPQQPAHFAWYSPGQIGVVR